VFSEQHTGDGRAAARPSPAARTGPQYSLSGYLKSPPKLGDLKGVRAYYGKYVGERAYDSLDVICTTDTTPPKRPYAAAIIALCLALMPGCHLRTQDTEIDIRSPHDAPSEEDEPKERPPAV